MRTEKFTVKAQEAVQSAQSLARRRDHQSVEIEHVLLALLDQQDGIVVPVLQKIGVELKLVRSRVEEELAKLPSVHGGEAYLSQRTLKMFDRAEDEAKSLKDEYVSTEHLLLACRRQEGRSGGAASQRASPANACWRAEGGARLRPRRQRQPRGASIRSLEKYCPRPHRSRPARASSTRSSVATKRSAA